MKKLKITKLLFCLILVINSCGPDEVIVTTSEDVTIGNQIWSSKNLDVQKYRNGDTIAQVQDKTAWLNLKTGAWCYYENNSANGSTYGKLYNWYAVNDPRGLAPKGYHIPTDAEWSILTTYLGTNAAAKMKSSSGWRSYKVNGTEHSFYRLMLLLHCGYKNSSGTNTSCFGGLPGGYRFKGYFNEIGGEAYWWSSSEGSASIAWFRNLDESNGNVSRYNNNKRSGFSVRCLRDCDPSGNKTKDSSTASPSVFKDEVPIDFKKLAKETFNQKNYKDFYDDFQTLKNIGTMDKLPLYNAMIDQDIPNLLPNASEEFRTEMKNMLKDDLKLALESKINQVISEGSSIKLPVFKAALKKNGMNPEYVDKVYYDETNKELIYKHDNGDLKIYDVGTDANKAYILNKNGNKRFLTKF